MRIAIIGNAGGGKSTLARRLSRLHGLTCHEVDRILWRPEWKLAPQEEYDEAHASIIQSTSCIIEGMGRRESIRPRVMAATHAVLIDLPLWQHYWLVAERHAAWLRGELTDAPAGHGEMPHLRTICETVAKLDQEWLPEIRRMLLMARDAGVHLQVVRDFEELETFELEDC